MPRQTSLQDQCVALDGDEIVLQLRVLADYKGQDWLTLPITDPFRMASALIALAVQKGEKI